MRFQSNFLLLISSLFVLIPIYFCQDNEQNSLCKESFQCGSFQNISYPFWEKGQARNCGSPGFALSCERDVLLITIGPLLYRVLRINNREETFTVARDDLWNNLCPSSLYNMTLDFNIFNYGINGPNITLFYECSTIPGQELVLPNRFDCNVNGSTSFGFYLTSNYTPIVDNSTDLVRCKNKINVPVNLASQQSLANQSASANDLQTTLANGFEVRWFTNNTSCKQCIQSGGQCGYNSSSSSLVCNIKIGSKQRFSPSTIIIIVISVGTSAIAIFLITILYCMRGRCFLLSGYRNTERSNDQNIESFMRNWGSFAPKQYSYTEIKKMTNSLKEKLGQGGYGSVYKGKLLDGRLVAVKVLNETKGNGEDFINEVSSISKTSHVNVVTLLGFCYNKKRALIYEFMANGSLDKFIYKYGSLNSECHLEWKILYEITVGIARGLEYLHRGLNRRIVHFDIKPHNILLDQEFCPKISDFGLAKLSDKKESILSMSAARGTPGYIAPEVFLRHLGGVSHKSDVYSYGMMILEMVGVRKNVAEVVRSSEVYFPQWIYEHLELGKEINIQAVTCEEEEEISRKMILVGLWCIQTNPSDRPSIGKVVEMLEGSVQSLQIPPKPFLYSPKSSSQRLLSQDSFTSYSHISLDN